MKAWRTPVLLALLICGGALGHSVDLSVERVRLVPDREGALLEFQVVYPRQDTPLTLEAVTSVRSVARLERQDAAGEYHPVQRVAVQGGITAFGAQTAVRVRFVRAVPGASEVISLVFSDGALVSVPLSRPERDPAPLGLVGGALLWGLSLGMGVLLERRRRARHAPRAGEP